MKNILERNKRRKVISYVVFLWCRFIPCIHDYQSFNVGLPGIARRIGIYLELEECLLEADKNKNIKLLVRN